MIKFYYQVKDKDGKIIAEPTFDSVEDAVKAKSLDTRTTSQVGSKTIGAKYDR